MECPILAKVTLGTSFDPSTPMRRENDGIGGICADERASPREDRFLAVCDPADALSLVE